jgi:hypothetical protein
VLVQLEINLLWLICVCMSVVLNPAITITITSSSASLWKNFPSIYLCVHVSCLWILNRFWLHLLLGGPHWRSPAHYVKLEVNFISFLKNVSASRKLVPGIK